jgi:hypothetical protein
MMFGEVNQQSKIYFNFRNKINYNFKKANVQEILSMVVLEQVELEEII